MPYALNPTTGELDFYKATSTGTTSLPEYTSDPVSPTAGDAWILKTGGSSGGGKILFYTGMGTPITSKGSSTLNYKFSYRTSEGTTIRVTMA